MSDPMDFRGADPETLTEISRQAESYLGAQLTAGLASDQRSVAFASLIIGAAVVVGTGAVITLTGTMVPHFIGYVGLVVCAGLLVAAFLAMYAAVPRTFYYPGNNPAQWVEDISEGKPLAESRAEAVSLDANAIEHNKGVLADCALYLTRAMWTAWVSVTFGALATGGYLVGAAL